MSVLKIDNAKKYAEGRGVRLEVSNGRDVRNVVGRYQDVCVNCQMAGALSPRMR